MKRPFLLMLFMLITAVACGQVIRGRVLDRATHEPVDYASVYMNGTFIGTITDQAGEFELDISPYSGRSLNISAIGYNTALLNTLKSSEHHTVLLEEALYQIQEVSIASESLAGERRRSLQLFKREFLGASGNARDCHILNEDVLSFNYGSNHDTLKASAAKPLNILNGTLGYQITYYLDKFEYDRLNKTTTFTGNISFSRDLASNSSNRKEYEQKRKKTYLGSSKHFFTALWADRLMAEGFLVENARTEDALQPFEFVMEDTRGKSYLQFGEDLQISYNYYESTVHLIQGRAFFDKDGFFEPEAILWYGYMSESRIADWLPYEYSPGQ